MTATVLSYFMADDVRFESNGKLIAIGMYYNVTYKNIKSANNSTICIFATVTDTSEGGHTVSMSVEDDTFFSDGEDFISTLLLKIPGFIFPHSGSYSYTLIIDGEEVADNFLHIKYLEEPIKEPKRRVRKKISGK